ncbi:MAG: hypothetical protein KAX51_04885 [Chromatiaceae bacterium]|nr:hypothetical protein [Chromatiaceae bacterium]MBP6807156.1 hypothetical protein [Chromatiaceae bacterium]MBP8289133.1 hypothetical protein [Chromatiaceae bacterium]MBP9603555.1 hypothetical protein [Chromatiaceae bacterium]
MATRHYYSTGNFFRQMPNALLARYFEGQGLFSDLDFSAMNETKPDGLFTAWLDLPKARRKPMPASGNHCHSKAYSAAGKRGAAGFSSASSFPGARSI